MTTTGRSSGDTLDTVATAAYTGGRPYALGTDLVGVALDTYAIGDVAVFDLEGVHELELAGGAVITVGDPAFILAASNPPTVTHDPTGNQRCGVFHDAADAGIPAAGYALINLNR